MGPLGYLVPEFPSQTHAFFWREVQALRSLGETVHLFSTIRPPQDACRHEFGEAAAAETQYLFPAGPDAARVLLQRPRKSLQAFRYVLGLRETPWHRRILLLGLVPSAALLVHICASRGIDHVHIHSCANAAHLGALSLILGGPTYSLTLHGDLPIYGTDHVSKMARASFVACVTRPLRDDVMRMTGLPAERVPVIWMGVDPGRFRDSSASPGVAGRLRAISVARLTYPKGHRYALEALRAVRDRGIAVEYLIVGDGPYRDGVENEVRASGMQKETVFCGNVSEEEVANLIAGSDVLLLPSTGIGEAAPVAVMEAMASGKPVIASEIGGTPDMIREGVTGFLCPPENPGAIADRLMKLAADVGLRQEIGRRARAHAEQFFDSRHMARRLLDVIRSSPRVVAASD